MFSAEDRCEIVPVIWIFDISFVVGLNKLFSKQSCCRDLRRLDVHVTSLWWVFPVTAVRMISPIWPSTCRVFCTLKRRLLRVDFASLLNGQESSGEHNLVTDDICFKEVPSAAYIISSVARSIPNEITQYRHNVCRCHSFLSWQIIDNNDTD